MRKVKHCCCKVAAHKRPSFVSLFRLPFSDQHADPTQCTQRSTARWPAALLFLSQFHVPHLYPIPPLPCRQFRSIHRTPCRLRCCYHLLLLQMPQLVMFHLLREHGNPLRHFGPLRLPANMNHEAIRAYRRFSTSFHVVEHGPLLIPSKPAKLRCVVQTPFNHQGRS